MVSHENKQTGNPAWPLSVHAQGLLWLCWCHPVPWQHRRGEGMDPAWGNSLLLPWQCQEQPQFSLLSPPWALCHQPSTPSPLLPSFTQVYLWRAVMSLRATENFYCTLYPNQLLHFSQAFSLFLNSFFLLNDSLLPLQLILFHFFPSLWGRHCQNVTSNLVSHF